MRATWTLPLHDQTRAFPGKPSHRNKTSGMRQNARAWKWGRWQPFEQPSPKRVFRFIAPTCFSHVPNNGGTPFSDRHPSQSLGRIRLRSQHGGPATNILRVVEQRRRQQCDGQRFVGKLVLTGQRGLRFRTIRVMTAASLRRQGSQFLRAQPQPPRLVQQR